MVELLGYDGVDRLYEFTGGLSPMLLLGPSGLGKRKWCKDRAEEFAGPAMTKVLSFPKVADLAEYTAIRNGQFKNSWVIDLTTVFNGKATNLGILPSLESFLKASVNDFTKVFLHSDVDVPQSIHSLATSTYVPLLNDTLLYSICNERGYEADESEFAVNFAQGVPGDMTTAFAILKRRTIIFELRELLLEDKVAKMEDRIKQLVTKEDLVYLKNILSSFDTGNWTLFKEHEVSFLSRVKELIRNVLSFPNANAEICFVTIFHAAAHVYHGRV